MAVSTDDLAIFPPEEAPPAAPAPTRRSPSRFLGGPAWLVSAFGTVALGFILPAALFALWWTAADRHWIAEQILPSPAFVWESLGIVWDSGELLGHVGHSARRAALSLLIGGGAGLVLGFAMGLSERIRAYVWPSFNALAQLPVLGWIPLLIIFVGIEEGLKLSAISIAVVVPVALSTLNGIANIPAALLEVGRVYRFNAWQTLVRIVLPATTPALFTGLRQGVMQAWLTTIFVELLSSSEGLGFFMSYSRSLSQIDMVIVSMLAIGVLGIAIELTLRLVESRLQGWRRNAF
ncbi:ABC transporter permease [uncultured Aquabacterium sp.]|uniref:ABC transporter permease n=1 Tax=Aquabacterium sp. TaxID=1872578 RepID=UPI0025D56334|nr:ABC transporter permease [uncultured Aquabacterium sp.]